MCNVFYKGSGCSRSSSESQQHDGVVVVEEKFLQGFAKPAQVKEGERMVARERPGVGAQPLTSIYRVRVKLG